MIERKIYISNLPVSNSKTNGNACNELEEEDKEKHHEVHRTVIPKGFVGRSEPTYIRTGCKKNGVQET